MRSGSVGRPRTVYPLAFLYFFQFAITSAATSCGVFPFVEVRLTSRFLGIRSLVSPPAACVSSSSGILNLPIDPGVATVPVGPLVSVTGPGPSARLDETLAIVRDGYVKTVVGGIRADSP